MSDCVIGRTGFVGSFLMNGLKTADGFNSKDIHEIEYRNFDTIYCAGVQAKKWWANQNPDEDKKGIEKLKASLEKANCSRFILISTIDVFSTGSQNGTERTLQLDPNVRSDHAYGRNRYDFELWCKEHFKDCVTVRLPALFGSGLRKNALYDLMNDNNVELLSPDLTFQWYDLEWLIGDLKLVSKNGIRDINLMTEPVRLGDIVETFFSAHADSMKGTATMNYDVKTIHDGLFKHSDGYIRSSADVMDAMKAFIGRNQ